jgi:hypothetical protein
MDIYELEMDEDQFRQLVKNIIDEYESGLHKHGSYDAAVKATQDRAIHDMSTVAMLDEDEIPSTVH